MQETNKIKCLLLDPKTIIVPYDKGSPPPWAPYWSGGRIAWVDRRMFDELKVRKYNMPCDICPLKGSCVKYETELKRHERT